MASSSFIQPATDREGLLGLAHPDKHAIAQSAGAQDASPFFSMLPLEVRELIYVEFWRLSGLRQHIMDGLPRSGHKHSPCIARPGDEDIRYARFREATSPAAAKWERRLKSSWNIHWACEELNDGGSAEQGRAWSPFLPVLLTCKRFYIEGFESLYGTVTFCFTGLAKTREFLCSLPPATLRSLEVSIRATPLITELYYSTTGELAAHFSANVPITAHHNPWQWLCQALAGLTRLRDLRVWVDSEDLRPWHQRVVERAFFAKLADVRAASFVLELPEIPDDPSLRGLPAATFLRDGEEGLPFRVKRGRRPNNWQVHLSGMSQPTLFGHH